MHLYVEWNQCMALYIISAATPFNSPNPLKPLQSDTRMNAILFSTKDNSSFLVHLIKLCVKCQLFKTWISTNNSQFESMKAFWKQIYKWRKCAFHFYEYDENGCAKNALKISYLSLSREWKCRLLNFYFNWKNIFRAKTAYALTLTNKMLCVFVQNVRWFGLISNISKENINLRFTPTMLGTEKPLLFHPLYLMH